MESKMNKLLKQWLKDTVATVSCLDFGVQKGETYALKCPLLHQASQTMENRSYGRKIRGEL